MDLDIGGMPDAYSTISSPPENIQTNEFISAHTPLEIAILEFETLSKADGQGLGCGIQTGRRSSCVPRIVLDASLFSGCAPGGHVRCYACGAP